MKVLSQTPHFLVTFFVTVFSIHTPANQDLPINASDDEVRKYEYNMRLAMVPEGSERFQVNPTLLLNGAEECATQHPSFFDVQMRSESAARSTAIERLKKEIFYLEITTPDDDSYFMGKSEDMVYHLCTMMILTGVKNIDKMFSEELPTSFLYQAITLPEISETALDSMFRSFSKAPDTTAEKIDGFFNYLFQRNPSWKVIESITDDIFRSTSAQAFYLTNEFLNHLYSSEIFKNYKVFFSQKILKDLLHANLSIDEKTKIILTGIGYLEDELVAHMVLESLSMWKFSQEEVIAIYKAFSLHLTAGEKVSVIRQIIGNYDSVSDQIKEEINSLLKNEEIRRRDRETLLRAVLADTNLYAKYGYNFVIELVENELKESTRAESTFVRLSSLTRDTELNPKQKESILNNLASDQNPTPKKIMDLLSAVEFYLLTSEVPGSTLKPAIDKIIELAPKDERVGDFLRRIVLHTPYSGEFTDLIAKELIRNFVVSSGDAESLVMNYYSNGSSSAATIIHGLVMKNEMTVEMGKVIAAIPNNLVSGGQYKELLEYALNHPTTDENAKRTIRYKLTGEIPTLENLPILNWDILEQK